MTETSIYVANKMSDIINAESWLGSKLDAIQLVGGFSSWWDWSTSPNWIGQQVSGSTQDIKWSIGLFPWGSNLADAAAHNYDSYYTDLAKQMVSTYKNNDQIYIRVGWEFNGDGWFPWSAKGQEVNYAQAYRNFVDAFRSVSNKFVFEWTPNVGDMGVNLEKAYPGDKYVDVIGTDFYYDIKLDSKDPIKAWNIYVNKSYGLQWQQDFAAAHGKPTAIGEWGVNSDTAGPFIEMAAQWFSDHNMVYQNYWNSDADFAGTLSSGQYPNAAAAFKAIFGGGENTLLADTKAIIASGTDQVNVMIGHAGDDVLKGMGGDDWLHGNAGNDKLYGGDGNDHLFGGSGNDLLDGGTGADIMAGGTGDDTYYVDNVGDKVVERDGEGYDQVFSTVSFDLAGTFVEKLTLTGTANINATGNQLDNVLIGNSGNNVISGGAGNDWIDGGAGNDTLTGGTGNDTFSFVGGFGHDVITDFGANGDRDIVDVSRIYTKGYSASLYQSGNDAIIDFGAGNDIRLVGVQLSSLQKTATGFALEGGTAITTLNGSSADDVIVGTSGNDRINGGAGADKLNGGAGNDWIDGGAGNDTLTGGAGNDTFSFVGGFGHDAITDFGANGDRDVIDVSAIYQKGYACSLYQSGNDAVIDFGGGNDIRLVGVQLSSLQKTATGFALEGGSAITTLNGSSADDVIFGTSGNDRISGGAGADKLNGGDGDDWIDGGAGNDILTGGRGNDTFSFFGGFGHDVITDFGANGDHDVVDVSRIYKAGYSSNVYQSGNDTIIDFGAGNDIRLLNLNANQLHHTADGLFYL